MFPSAWSDKETLYLVAFLSLLYIQNDSVFCVIDQKVAVALNKMTGLKAHQLLTLKQSHTQIQLPACEKKDIDHRITRINVGVPWMCFQKIGNQHGRIKTLIFQLIAAFILTMWWWTFKLLLFFLNVCFLQCIQWSFLFLKSYTFCLTNDAKPDKKYFYR